MTVYRNVPLDSLPKGYKTIYCDIPWGFETWAKKLSIPQRTAIPHYLPMTMADIMALPVSEIAAKDAVLHMWVISSHMDQAWAIAKAWGFTFRSFGLNWVKTQKGDPEKPKMGMGKWFRQESEVSLLFARGKIGPRDRGVRQVILEPAREHSRKPDEGIVRVERLTEGPYLEMFSRSDREGWDSWGNEAGNFAKRKALVELTDPDYPDLI